MEPRKIEQHGGFTLIELLLVIAIIAIIAAISLPGLMRARIAANESSAIASLRTISSAQATYSSTCGAGGFAPSLEELGRSPLGSPVPFIPPDLASGEKSGYTLVVEGYGDQAAADTCTGSGETTFRSFLATANPITDGRTGVRAFGIDKANALRWTAAEAGIVDGPSYLAALVLQ